MRFARDFDQFFVSGDEVRNYRLLLRKTLDSYNGHQGRAVELQRQPRVGPFSVGPISEGLWPADMRWQREGPVDLHTAVAVSMLPVSRGPASAVFKDLRERFSAPSLEQVLDGLFVPRREHSAMISAATQAAVQALGRAGGMEPVAWFDARYPALLNCIQDPPPVLWVRGNLPVLARPAVAVIGSRAATGYALAVGARLAAELVARSIVVVSGLARGVDSSAHRGALNAEGSTVAVLGSGLDKVYPPEHAQLADQIAATGAVISELGPGAAPLPEHFPLRNRIISGISLAVVVVEASEKSGSLITARCALEQGRDVCAVPGSVLTGRNRGSHSLLKDGAKVVETADDILEELGWPSAAIGVDPTCKLLNTDPLLSRLEPGEEYELDELVEASGTPASRLLVRLTELELMGHVTAVRPGCFARVLPAGGRRTNSSDNK
jgi:DNA processing protein